MKLDNLPILLSTITVSIAIPLTLVLVKINQDYRSQAMAEQFPLATIKPINILPTPTPTLNLNH